MFGSSVGHGVCSLHRDQLLLRRQCKETLLPDAGELLSLKSTWWYVQRKLIPPWFSERGGNNLDLSSMELAE